MAYAAAIDEDEEQHGQPEQGAEKVLSGESSTVASGPAGGTGAAAAPKPTGSGGGWTNLTSYVKANEGQDARMGEAVKGKYEQGQAGARSTVDNYNTTATGKINSATVADSGLVGRLNAVKPPTPASQPASAAPAAPAPQAPAAPLTADAASQFAAQTTGYKGPNAAWDVDGFGSAERGVSDTVAAAGMANDFEGRRTYLKDIYGEPRYSAGEQRLDSFITGAGSGGRAALDDVQNQSGQLKTGWEDLVNRVGGDIDTARTTTNNTKDQTLQAYQGAVDRSGSAIRGAKDALDATTAADKARYDNALGTIENGGPAAKVPEKARALAVERAWKQTGLSPDQVEEAKFLMEQGVSLRDIIQHAQTKGLGDVVGKEDQDTWSALGAIGKEGGIDPLETYDFKSTGGPGGSFDLNEGMVEGSKEYRAMETAIKNRLATEQNKRSTESDPIPRALVNGGWNTAEGAAALAQIGITPEQVAKATKLHINPMTFYSSGTRLNAGDVATDQERARWGELLGSLGISPSMELADSQNEGGSYGFDKSGFLNALAANTVAPAPAAPAKKKEPEKSATGKYFDKHAGKG